MFILALAGGAWIFLGVVIALFLAVVFGYYTRRGSAINQRPYSDRNAMSGPSRPSELAHDVSQDIQNWDRGVGGHRRPRRFEPREKLDDEQLAEALRAWRERSGNQRLGQLAPGTPARGPVDGAEVIVFWDYAESESPALAAELAKLRASTSIREAALQLPVADAHPLSFTAALALEAAREQGSFWAVHDRLLERPPKSDADVLATAELVADPERFRAAIADRAGRERIIDDIRVATTSGVRALPAIFIGGLPYDGEQTAAALETVLNSTTARRFERRIPGVQAGDAAVAAQPTASSEAPT